MTSKLIIFPMLLSLAVASCSKSGNLTLLGPDAQSVSRVQALSTASTLEKIAADSTSTIVSGNELPNALRSSVKTLNSTTSQNIETVSDADDSIQRIVKLQKEKNLNDRENYLKLILDSLAIPDSEVEYRGASIGFFVNRLISYVEDQNLTILQDLYLIRSLQNLKFFQSLDINANDEDKVSYKQLNDYLFKKYKFDEKSNSDILNIFAATINITDNESDIVGVVRKILKSELLDAVKAPEVEFLLSKAITITAGEFNKDYYGVKGDDANIFISNILNYSNQLASKLTSKTNKSNIITSIICLDSIFYFFEENLSYLVDDSVKVEKIADDFWFNQYRAISQKLIQGFPDIEKSNVALNLTPRSLLLKAIKFEKERVFANAKGVFTLDDVNGARGKDYAFFREKVLGKDIAINGNYAKELAYGVYLHSVMSNLLSFTSVVDAPIKIRDLQDVYKNLNSIKNGTSEIIKIDDKSDLLTKGFFDQSSIVSTHHLIIHPLSYVKASALNLDFTSVEGGVFDASAEIAEGIIEKNIFEGTLPTQTYSVKKIENRACYTVRFFDTTCYGQDRWQHTYGITAGISPGKANEGAMGNAAGSINAKFNIPVNNMIIQPLFLANGGKGAQGQIAKASPLCSADAYHQMLFRSGTRITDGGEKKSDDIPENLFEANVPADVTNGEPGNGGVGGNGGEINIVITKNNKTYRVLATAIGGAGGESGRPNRCNDRSGKTYESIPASAGNSGRVSLN
jgi:hypothetical protein